MKKKTKKKRLHQQWQFCLIIGIIIAGIFVIVTLSSEPHFKIYEEVCENETFITEIGQVDTSLVALGLEEIPSIPNNAEFSCPTNSNICRINIVENRTICEQVEVEEIEVYDKVVYYNASKDYIPSIMFANTSYELINSGDDYWFYENYEKIQKSDLTLEWLYEKCKIQKGKCLKWGKRRSDGTSICKDEIREFFCGEKDTHLYVVEVWNQIK